MKKLITVGTVHIHTQGNLTNKINKVDEINLYINVYKTDQLII